MPREYEAEWQKAKKKVKEEYPDLTKKDDAFWKLTSHIFQSMKPINESVLPNGGDLIYRNESGEYKVKLLTTDGQLAKGFVDTGQGNLMVDGGNGIYLVIDVPLVEEVNAGRINKDVDPPRRVGPPNRTFADWFGDDLTGQTYEGNITCWMEDLTSLEGAPSKVIGDFDCSNNFLTGLTGGPKEVTGNYDASHNRIVDLAGASKLIGGDFDISVNRVRSHRGGPDEIGGNYIVYDNPIGKEKFIESDLPKHIGGRIVYQ